MYHTLYQLAPLLEHAEEEGKVEIFVAGMDELKVVLNTSLSSNKFILRISESDSPGEFDCSTTPDPGLAVDSHIRNRVGNTYDSPRGRPVRLTFNDGLVAHHRFSVPEDGDLTQMLDGANIILQVIQILLAIGRPKAQNKNPDSYVPSSGFYAGGAMYG